METAGGSFSTLSTATGPSGKAVTILVLIKRPGNPEPETVAVAVRPWHDQFWTSTGSDIIKDFNPDEDSLWLPEVSGMFNSCANTTVLTYLNGTVALEGVNLGPHVAAHDYPWLVVRLIHDRVAGCHLLSVRNFTAAAPDRLWMAAEDHRPSCVNPGSMTTKISPDLHNGQTMICKETQSATQHIDTSNLLNEIEGMYDIRLAATFLQDALEQKDFLMHPKTPRSIGSDFISSVRREIHLLLCTQDAKYKKERAALSSTAAPGIAALSAMLVAHFGMSIGTAGALVAVLLLIPLRLSINAWCRMFNDSPSVMSESEVNELKKISEQRDGA